MDYELIVTIVNRGFNDVVMDAARQVGARGGTIINAAAPARTKRKNSLASPFSRKKK